MKTFIVFLSGLFLCGQQLRGAQGIIQTLDGKKFDGELQLDTGGITASGTNRVSARVEWANLSLLQFQSAHPDDIPTPTGRSEENLRTNSAGPRLPPGILLTSGSFIARRISSADQSALHFVDLSSEATLSIVNVARILFQPLPSHFAARIPPGRPGLLLSNKDFVEGEFKGFAAGQITISSVLFGNTSYDPGQVIAVILRETKPAPSRFWLKTKDESLFLADAFQVQDDSLTVQDPNVPGVKIKTADVLEIKRRAN